MKRSRLPFGLILICVCGLYHVSAAQNTHQKHDLYATVLARSWDEGMPLGNGTLGALVWQKGTHLRLSLDRSDLWDLRPMKGLHSEGFSYKWVQEQLEQNNYQLVQKYLDEPYDREPAPARIPAGALELDITTWGEVSAVHLSTSEAVCEVRWRNGIVLKTFVHATQPTGWFRFENLKTDFKPQLVAPPYEGAQSRGGDPVAGDDLSRLGYKQGKIISKPNAISYVQHGWGGFVYRIFVSWKKTGPSTVEGVWSISAHRPGEQVPAAEAIVTNASTDHFDKAFEEHVAWWQNYWSRSSLTIPDTLLEQQWYLEQYKFGSAARRGAPPVSLQAVWTADNGRLPPWKGDYHHDLNTQLSYWPAYSSNHLEEAMGYLDHFEKNKANYKRYTKRYFGTDGLAVPGVTTLDGTEMGGWIQYALSPTISAWISHHYYLQWRYSMDVDFLKNKAYPWIKQVAIHLEQLTEKDENGWRKLPISSSPEVHGNDASAWFKQNTNYDLALMRFTFGAAAELATVLGLPGEAAHWQQVLNEFTGYALSEKNELKIAPSLPYAASHRHFSHLLAIHPLGLIKWEDGAQSQAIIKNSLDLLEQQGPANWCGYSYAWLASLEARAKDGERAAKSLDIFARAFCLKNSFHANGDQSGKGYSSFTYRPFTLEGNFAFAAGLQEMLLQSYAGFIEIMPAVPAAWKDISFHQLRAEGAFLVDAKKENGLVDEVKVVSEKGGATRLKLPFKTFFIQSKKDVAIVNTGDGFVNLDCKPGGTLIIRNGYE